MKSTMQDFPINIAAIFRHGRSVHAKKEVVTCEGASSRRTTYGAVADRAERLAAALRRLGVRPDDRVGTLAWNTQEHLEAYFAVPLMGAVLHTLNLRLFPDQLEYVINHAEDSVILVEDSVVPVLARVAPHLKTVRHIIVIGSGDASALRNPLRYEDLIAAEKPGFAWPEIDERAAAGMCYTSGTTGNPKGVVYSHRSTFLHSMGLCMAGSIGLNETDRVLPIVPMFHANAWGLPYGAWFAGSDFLFPGRFLQPEPLCAFIRSEKPTVSAGVPTVWIGALNHPAATREGLSSLRTIVVGGAAVPRSLIEAFDKRFGVRIIQGWGMTETSPLAALARPPPDVPPQEQLNWRAMTGRVVPGVEVRITDSDGKVQPWDGEAVGEIECRGPWVTAAYYRDDSPDRFHDGWLRTGDVGTINDRGFIQITDRAKDVIKSGGEWISSVEIENAVMAHPDVLECAVIAAPDDKWSERPLACVVKKSGSTLAADALRAFLVGRVAEWAIPENWAFIAEVPKTSVGKFDKKVLRARYAQNELEVTRFPGPGARRA